MSSTLALARPLRREHEEERPHLEIAATRAQRRARPKLVYALVVVGGMGAILLAQLLLSIVVADGAYRISSLQLKERDYSRQQQALSEKLDVLGSTQNLTTRAEALGMVTSGNPVFLNAGTGAVTGTSTAAGGSLVGAQGNLVGNSLLKGDAVDQQALEQAQQQGEAQTPVTEEDGGIATVDGGTGAGSGSAGGGSTSGGSPGSTGSGASNGTTGGGSVPSAPGVIPSPTTH